jgi:hypothetical protein
MGLRRRPNRTPRTGGTEGTNRRHRLPHRRAPGPSRRRRRIVGIPHVAGTEPFWDEPGSIGPGPLSGSGTPTLMDRQMPPILILTEANFHKDVLASEVPMVVERLLNVVVGPVSTDWKDRPSGVREL